MNKKISSTFGILVVLIIAGFFGYVFLMGNEEVKTTQNEKEIILNKNENKKRLTEDKYESKDYCYNLSCSSRITSINNDWNKYTNERLGFEIKIPKKAFYFYIEKFGYVPIEVFENDKTNIVYVYFSNSSLLEYGDYDSDKLIKTTYDLRESQYEKYPTGFRFWGIEIIDSIEGEKDIQELVSKKLGKECKVENISESKQDGVYNIILADTGAIGTCPNIAYGMYYYPEKNKIAMWGIGQEAIFLKELGDVDGYEGGMDFQFLK